MLPIAVYHEHPDWFRPLLAELRRRDLPVVVLDPRAAHFDPGDAERRYGVFVNRMSPSAYLRGGVQGTWFTHALLAHLESTGTPVVNGARAYAVETSKAAQLTLLRSLGLPYPRARVINHASQALAASEGLRFPVVVKANVGGSGAGIVRFDAPDALAGAVERGEIDLGIDHTALVQEFVPARGGSIVRVETLGQKFLYGIRVHLAGQGFNLCPADICQRADGVELVRGACAVDAPKTGLRVEQYTPPTEVIAAVEGIARAAEIDVGGIEYMADDRDGSLVYYDINALSNFVADAVNVVGFDPFARLADYIGHRAGGGAA